MSLSAHGYRKHYQDISGQLVFTTATDDTTLVTARNANSTIYIQRIVVYITTDAAQSIVFEDSNSSPRKVFEVSTSPGDETRWEYYSSDEGFALTEGKNFVMNVSATGLAGHVVWEGYTRITSPVAAGPTN